MGYSKDDSGRHASGGNGYPWQKLGLTTEQVSNWTGPSRGKPHHQLNAPNTAAAAPEATKDTGAPENQPAEATPAAESVPKTGDHHTVAPVTPSRRHSENAVTPSQPSRRHSGDAVTPSRLSLLPDQYTVAELLACECEETRWIVEDLIPEGLTLLAGRPKQGKSWLCLDIAMAVATGSRAMNEHDVEHGDVLFLSLEDGGRRLRKRLDDMGFEAPLAPLLTVRERLAPDVELHDLITQWAENSPSPRLVIIDTWVHVRPRQSGKDAYKQDYEALSNLRKMALEHGLVILVVMHLRKQEAIDPFDEISGSVGIGAAADTMLVLRKSRTDRRIELLGRGRDIEDFGRTVEFDHDICRWRTTGQFDPDATIGTGNRPASAAQTKILEFLENMYGAFMPSEITEAIGEKAATVRQNLKRLAERGQITQDAAGRYASLKASHDE